MRRSAPSRPSRCSAATRTRSATTFGRCVRSASEAGKPSRLGQLVTTIARGGKSPLCFLRLTAESALIIAVAVGRGRRKPQVVVDHRADGRRIRRSLRCRSGSPPARGSCRRRLRSCRRSMSVSPRRTSRSGRTGARESSHRPKTPSPRLSPSSRAPTNRMSIRGSNSTWTRSSKTTLSRKSSPSRARCRRARARREGWHVPPQATLAKNPRRRVGLPETEPADERVLVVAQATVGR